MEHNVVIPRTFTLVNREWTVVWDDCLKKGTLGECRAEIAEIALRPGLSTALLHHTFLHELCHAFCFSLGWDKLNAHEGKIDALSGVLHQFMQTAEGEIAPSGSSSFLVGSEE